MTIGIVGLDHLGIVSAITTAHKGYPIIAYDVDAKLISKLQQGIFPCYEPDLENLYKENSSKVNWTIYPHLLDQCNLIFITVDTPIDEDNKSNYDSIFWLLKIIVRYIDKDIPIIISSQVYPGFTRKISEILPNPVFYQPEFLVVGNAIELSCNPIQITVGCKDKNQWLPEVYKKFLKNYVDEIKYASYESAEIIKIATNIYLAAQVTTTNTLAEFCEHIKADWREVQPVIEQDKRIGSYLNPGLGLSGGHLERDIETVIRLSKSMEAEAYKVSSDHRKNWVNNLIYIHGQLSNLTVAIWGLTYKPNTNSIKNSSALYTIEYLNKFTNVNIKTYDPYNITTSQTYNSCTSPLEALHNADILCIMTADQRYSKFSLQNIKEYMEGNTIIDPYGMLNHEECIKIGFKHFQLGVPIIK